MLYLFTQEVQHKWKVNNIRNWSEIYPQLYIFFSEIMSKVVNSGCFSKLSLKIHKVGLRARGDLYEFNLQPSRFQLC